MRRSHIVIAGVIVLLIGYTAFVMSRPGSLARRWLGHDQPEMPAEAEPWLEGRPLHEWVADLNATQPAFRRQAAEVLGEAGKNIARHKQIAERLAELLSDPDPGLRLAAAVALGKVYVWAKGASQRLQVAAHDKVADVRCASLSALALIAGDDEAAFAALRTGLSDLNPDVRFHAVDKLKELGPHSESAVASLIEGLKASDPELRRAAIRALAWIGSPAERATPLLCAALKDSDAKVRSEAAAALAAVIPIPQPPALPEPAAIVPGKEAEQLPFELDPAAKAAVAAAIAARNDPDQGVRLHLLNFLGKFADYSEEARRALQSSLNDSDAEVRARGASLIGRVVPPMRDAAPQLLALINDTDRHVQTCTAIALSRMKLSMKEALPRLFGALKDPEDKDRLDAAWALRDLLRQPDVLREGDYGDIVLTLIRVSPIEVDQPEQGPATLAPTYAFTVRHSLQGFFHPRVAGMVVPRLVEALKEAKGDDKIQFTTGLFLALDALKDLELSEAKPETRLSDAQNARLREALRKAMPTLIEALQSTDYDLCMQTLQVLTVAGPEVEAAVPAICDVLRTQEPALCSFGLQALSRLGPAAKDATPCLIELLKDRAFRDRVNVVLTLGAIGPAAKAAVDPLLDCKDDQEPGMRQSIVHALKRIDAQAAKRVSPPKGGR
jgi:HEAT repeat protein